MEKIKMINGKPYYMINVNGYKGRLTPSMNLLRRAKINYITIGDKKGSNYFIFAKVKIESQMDKFDLEKKLCKVAGISRVDGIVHGYEKDFEWSKGEDLYLAKVRYTPSSHVMFYTKEVPTKGQAIDAMAIQDIINTIEVLYR